MKTTIEVIIGSICEYYDVNPYDIFRIDQETKFIELRKLFFYISVNYTKKTYREIGQTAKKYGGTKNFHHATVMYHSKTLGNILSVEKKTKKTVDEVLEIIELKETDVDSKKENWHIVELKKLNRKIETLEENYEKISSLLKTSKYKDPSER